MNHLNKAIVSLSSSFELTPSNDTFGLRPLRWTCHTFPGARLANGRGLEAVIASLGL